MPVVRKLDPEEVNTIERKGLNQRELRRQEYDEFIRQFTTGDYAEVIPDGETKPTIRHQFNAAAQRAGVDIKWLRGKSDTLKFKVEYSPFEAEEEGAEEEDTQVLVELLESTPEPAPTMELTDFEDESVEEIAQPVVVEKRKPNRRPKVTDTEVFVEAP